MTKKAHKFRLLYIVTDNIKRHSPTYADCAFIAILNFTQKFCALLTGVLSESHPHVYINCNSSPCTYFSLPLLTVYNFFKVSLVYHCHNYMSSIDFTSFSFFLSQPNIIPFSLSLPAEHKNRQYDNRKRTDTYYPVSVICPVHLLFVFHTLQTLFQLVIGFTFHALLLSFHAYKPSSFYNSSLSFFRKSFRVISQNFPVLFD